MCDVCERIFSAFVCLTHRCGERYRIMTSGCQERVLIIIFSFVSDLAFSSLHHHLANKTKTMTPLLLWRLPQRCLQPKPTPSPEQTLIFGNLDDANALQLRRSLLFESPRVAFRLVVIMGPKLCLRGAEAFSETLATSNVSSLMVTSAKNDNNYSALQRVYEGIQRSTTLRHLKITFVGTNHTLDLSRLPISLQSLALFFSDMDSPEMTRRILQSLNQGLRCTTTLTRLELGNWNLGTTDGADDEGNEAMQLLSCCGLGPHSSVTSLSLQGNFRDAHVAYFVEHTWRSDSPLQYLTLNSIYMTAIGMQRLLQATLNHPAIQSLTLNVMFSKQQEILNAIQRIASELPRLCLRQLYLELSLCNDDLDQPTRESLF